MRIQHTVWYTFLLKLVYVSCEYGSYNRNTNTPTSVLLVVNSEPNLKNELHWAQESYPIFHNSTRTRHRNSEDKIFIERSCKRKLGDLVPKRRRVYTELEICLHLS